MSLFEPFFSLKNHNENRHPEAGKQMVHCNNHGVFIARTRLGFTMAARKR